MEAPKRRFTVELHAGGDTRDDLVSAIKDAAFSVMEGSNGSVSGGCTTGFYFIVIEDSTMDAARFQKELREYIDTTSAVVSPEATT